MNFDIQCQSKEQAKLAIVKINSVILELGLRPDNYHVGTGLGGNPKQLLILSSLTHVLTDKQQGVYLNGRQCYWNVTSIASASRSEIRKYIDNAFEQRIPNSSIGPALLIGHLLSEGAASKFLDAYEINSDELPEVNSILEGKQFNIANLNNTNLLLVSTVATGLMSRKIDAHLKQERINLPVVDNVGSFMCCLPLETALIVIRSMVGIQRLVISDLDSNPSWEALLHKIASTIRDK